VRFDAIAEHAARDGDMVELKIRRTGRRSGAGWIPGQKSL